MGTLCLTTVADCAQGLSTLHAFDKEIQFATDCQRLIDNNARCVCVCACACACACLCACLRVLVRVFASAFHVACR
jgi:hypothetical protein